MATMLMDTAPSLPLFQQSTLMDPSAQPPSPPTPSPPSNTLLITNLQSTEIFSASNLDSIYREINQRGAIYTFSPLKSFRRIIVSFYSVDDAIAIRGLLEGEQVLGSRVRVYFGAATDTNPSAEDQHLRAPASAKQFFISPPPSPPVGWEMRNEGPPNRDVHAEDLASALARLHARPTDDDAPPHPSAVPEQWTGDSSSGPSRQRSGSTTVVYDPQDHGHSPHLPAIAVEDTSDGEGGGDPSTQMEGVENKFVRTVRPPVELMES